jgi:ACR3 family arsenite efflux pump ArsB
MIAALLILLPVVGVVAWVFFRYTPAHAERGALFRFNIVALIVAAGLGAAWSLRTYLLMSPTVDSAWWPVISALGVLVVVPLVLGLAAILRNFVVFRRDAKGSRQ